MAEKEELIEDMDWKSLTCEICTTAKGKRASVCQRERGLFVRLDLPKECRIQYP